MLLSGRQRHFLRALAHHRRPVVAIGNAGLSEGVLAEIERALSDHELIKIKLPAVRGPERGQLVEHLCRTTGAEAVQAVGRIALVYRPGENPRIHLPR